MTFVTKQVNTQTLGEYLTAYRRRLDLSIAEVGRLTRIQPRYLKSLEDGNYSDLPADVYVRGYLRILSKVYGLDERKLIAQYAAERGIIDNLKAEEKISPPKKFSIPFVLSPKTATISGIVLLGLISLGYLYFQVRSLSAAPELTLYTPQEDGSTESSLLEVSGKTEIGATIFINNQPIVVDAEGNFKENLSLAPGSNQLIIRARNKFGEDTQLARSIFYREKQIAGNFEAAPGEATATTTNLSGIKVEVVVGPDASWISLAADGETVYTGTMLPNAKREVRANEKVVLTTGNAGATRVIVDGQDRGILGANGEVLRNVEFTAGMH